MRSADAMILVQPAASESMVFALDYTSLCVTFIQINWHTNIKNTCDIGVWLPLGGDKGRWRRVNIAQGGGEGVSD